MAVGPTRLRKVRYRGESRKCKSGERSLRQRVPSGPDIYWTLPEAAQTARMAASRETNSGKRRTELTEAGGGRVGRTRVGRSTMILPSGEPERQHQPQLGGKTDEHELPAISVFCQQFRLVRLYATCRVNGGIELAGTHGGTWRSKQWDYRVGNFLAYLSAQPGYSSVPEEFLPAPFDSIIFSVMSRPQRYCVLDACRRPLKNQQRFHLKSVVSVFDTEPIRFESGSPRSALPAIVAA